MKLYLWEYKGITAATHSGTSAWALIRNECISRGIRVPTWDKIVRLRELTEMETKVIRERVQKNSK